MHRAVSVRRQLGLSEVALTDCDGNYIQLIACTSALYIPPTQEHCLPGALPSFLPSLLLCFDASLTVACPWTMTPSPPVRVPIGVSQLRFDLLTFRKISNTLWSAPWAWGQLNRPGLEDWAYQRRPDGYVGSYGVSHLGCSQLMMVLMVWRSYGAISSIDTQDREKK